MKMICPHCGVKGSADNSLLDTKVKCPKCQGIFTVAPEIIQPIPIEEFELEQLGEDTGTDDVSDDIANEVDDLFNDMFGEEEATTVKLNEDEIELGEEDSELMKLLDQESDDESEEEMIAALSDEYDEDADLNEDSELMKLLDQESDDEPEEEMIAALSDKYDEDADLEEDSELMKLLDQEPDDEPEEEMIAALSDEYEEPVDLEEEIELEEDVDLEEWAQGAAAFSEFEDDVTEQVAESEEVESDEDDDTLTVIEGLPTETDSLETEEEIEDEISLDDTDTLESFDDIEEIEVDGFTEPVVDVEGDDPEMEELEKDEVTAELDNMMSVDSAEVTEELSDEDQEQEENLVQKCSACGEYVDPLAKYEQGSNVYCTKCVPAQTQEEDPTAGTEDGAASVVASTVGKFTITTLIKDSWRYCKGVKGSIWAGLIVMYLILFGIGGAGFFLVPIFSQGGSGMFSLLAGVGVEILAGFFSYIFTAGLILIAVKRVGQQPFSWKMVFSGFKIVGTLTVAIILQLLLLTIGFCLFILPGIYLSIGYMLTFPLIMEKGLSPWQAMETSRKAIHKRWWTVFFTFIVLSIIATISAIPAGIGLIWTVPMFFVMVGILYYHFFGDEE